MRILLISQFMEEIAPLPIKVIIELMFPSGQLHHLNPTPVLLLSEIVWFQTSMAMMGVWIFQEVIARQVWLQCLWLIQTIKGHHLLLFQHQFLQREWAKGKKNTTIKHTTEGLISLPNASIALFPKLLLIYIIKFSYRGKQGPRTPPTPSQENISPESTHENRKRRRTPPPRDTSDPVGYSTPPKRSRKDKGTASPIGRDRDYREASRGKNSRDRDYRERDSERRPRSPRYESTI